MTGVSQAAFGALEDVDDLRIVDTTPEIPFAIMMYPLEVELGVRLSLSEAISGLIEDREQGGGLRLLLAIDAVAPFDAEALAPFTAFMETTGYDFALLGN